MIRAARPTDNNYVAQSWVRSLGQLHDYSNNETVNQLLDDPRTVVSCACAPTDSDRILGWIASASIPGCRVLQYVLVRNAERGKGLGRQLLEHAGFLRSDTPIVMLFEPKKFPLPLGRRAHLLSPKEFIL